MFINVDCKIKNQHKTYREKLESCGKQTNIRINRGFECWIKTNISYKTFRSQYLGTYEEGRGYVVSMTLADFFDFIEKYGPK